MQNSTPAWYAGTADYGGGGGGGGLIVAATPTTYTLSLCGIVLSFLLGLGGSLLPSVLARVNMRAAARVRREAGAALPPSSSPSPSSSCAAADEREAAKREAAGAVEAMLAHPLTRLAAGFSAGAIISVGFVHSFPEGSEVLARALPGYPYAGALAMGAFLLAFAIEQGVSLAHGGAHGAHGDGDGAGPGAKAGAPATRLAVLVELYTLLAGVTFHSFFVGVGIGLQESAALLVAVLAHQLFEGVAVGIRALRARGDRLVHVLLLEAAFALACPAGIVAGVVARVSIGGAAYEIVSGSVSALSAGILVYVGAVHLLIDECRRSAGERTQLVLVYVGVALGAAAMSALAVWT